MTPPPHRGGQGVTDRADGQQGQEGAQRHRQQLQVLDLLDIRQRIGGREREGPTSGDAAAAGVQPAGDRLHVRARPQRHGRDVELERVMRAVEDPVVTGRE